MKKKIISLALVATTSLFALTSFGSWKHGRHRILGYGCIISRHMFVSIHAIDAQDHRLIKSQ